MPPGIITSENTTSNAAAAGQSLERGGSGVHVKNRVTSDSQHFGRQVRDGEVVFHDHDFTA